MVFNSIVPAMREDALRLPTDRNVKVYMRHSIRFDNPPDGDYSKLLLTPEGIEIANRIGRELDYPVGYFYSSPVERCVQTATEIAKGAGISAPVIENVREFAHLEGLGHAQRDLGIGWYEFYYGLQRGIPELTGGITLKEAATPIVDKIFEVPETDKALDVIVSHDSHVVTLASALFDFKTGINGEGWITFTEGMFIYGSREDFTVLWRGEEKRFVNW